MHVGALPCDAQLPIATGGIRASIAASAMHPSISLLAYPMLTDTQLDKLCNWLQALPADVLDEMLKERDVSDLDMGLNKIRPAIDAHLPDQSAHKETFFRISALTRCHEITSYVVEDLALLSAAHVAGFSSDLTRHLVKTYTDGRFPTTSC